MDEQTAITRMKNGDIGGLAVMVEKYQTQAVRTAYMIVRDQGIAEDVVQATFVRIFHRIDQFDTTRRFEPWFMRSVVNAALQHERRAGRQTSLDAPINNADSSLTFADMLHADGPDPAEAAEAAELREMIWKALDALSPDQRAVVVMRYYLDCSEREMSEALDTPAGTIKWRLHAARKRLAVLLRADLLADTPSRESGDGSEQTANG